MHIGVQIGLAWNQPPAQADVPLQLIHGHPPGGVSGSGELDHPFRCWLPLQTNQKIQCLEKVLPQGCSKNKQL